MSVILGIQRRNVTFNFHAFSHKLVFQATRQNPIQDDVRKHNTGIIGKIYLHEPEELPSRLHWRVIVLKRL